ncbi:hypothetical protein BXY_21350 [Bacteroides xylanisolvens XB1A]|jgi:hypothetical protein|uniref:Uncharacterized protein n=1 Tax=Bacteroides xylanisolvens XB1A TaxID=657309 RepID=D6CYG1_9BACE|nr:hypothetical protein BXY_21350 [Bacteroides xylanisolvens XB1A]
MPMNKVTAGESKGEIQAKLNLPGFTY